MRLSSLILAALALLAPSATQAAGPPRGIAEALHGRLVRVEAGRLAATTLPRNVRYTAFYFGASWCGPCRAFVPELRQGHARLRAAGHPAEIVFVSDDRDCRRMADYILASRMPWPAVACRDRDRLGWLQRARGAALPGMLIYDAQGKVVASSWSRTGHSRPRQALAELERLASTR